MPERKFGKSFPWLGLRSDDYDRMSVLLSELNRYPHKVELISDGSGSAQKNI